MNEQNLNNADQALEEMIAIAKKYGLSSVIILADEVGGTFGLEISNQHSDQRPVIKGIYNVTKFIREYLKHSPQGFVKRISGKRKHN